VSVLESKRTDYRGKAVLEPCSDEALVSNVFLNLKKTERLTEQLTTTIGSVFCAHEAAELVGIALDWAKHVDEDQVRETLCALLRECERGTQGFCAGCSRTFSSRCPVLGKRGRVPYWQHRNLVDA
jgi:hypothetical protein